MTPSETVLVELTREIKRLRDRAAYCRGLKTMRGAAEAVWCEQERNRLATLTQQHSGEQVGVGAGGATRSSREVRGVPDNGTVSADSSCTCPYPDYPGLVRSDFPVHDPDGTFHSPRVREGARRFEERHPDCSGDDQR